MSRLRGVQVTSAVGALALAVGVFVLARFITGRYLSYAIERRLLDVPKDRSAHSAATPRGGGIGIAISMCAAVFFLMAIGRETQRYALALLAGGAITAITGFIDDRRGVSVVLRLCAHCFAAYLVILLLGGPPNVLADLGLAPSPWVLDVVVLIYLVWLLNLTNFMDGIDGLASVEVITVALGGVVLYLSVAPSAGGWLTLIALASATSGFLVWNWPPAKMFMGDSGSGFLGIVLGVCSLEAAIMVPVLFWSWLILMGCFVVDATVTLLWRVLQREQFTMAHSSHAYQYAARRWSHRGVTLAVGVINVFWLLPVASLVASGRVPSLVGVVLAYVPLIGAVVVLRANGLRRSGQR